MAPTIRRRSTLAWLAAGSLLPLGATADSKFPERPITLVVPNALRGGDFDLGGLRVRYRNGDHEGSTFVDLAMVTREGGAPFGDELLALIRAAGYAPRDFTPITKVGVTQMVLLARPGLGVTTVDQLVALARQKPNGLSLGITGSASLQAFAAVALQRAAGVDLLGVPYKGGAPMLNDLLAGQVDLGIAALPGALPHVRAGKLVALGLLSEKRATSRPRSRACRSRSGPPWPARPSCRRRWSTPLPGPPRRC